MSESFDWHSFLESVEALCRQVEHRIQLSDSNTLQDFLFRLQAKRTACERLIGAAVASGVDTSVSENVQGNVKRLSNVIKHLIDDVERQLQSVDSTVYSASIFSETLVHRNGSVGRHKLVINLHSDRLSSQLAVYMDKDMPRINLKINIQTQVTAFAPVSLFGLNGTSLTASFFFLLSRRESFNQRKG